MYKLIIVLVVYLALTEGRPFRLEKEQHVPVYIQIGDTPLWDIDPKLAEAFGEVPAGRSVGKEVEAAPDVDDVPKDQKEVDLPEISEANEKKIENYEVKPEERR